MKKLGNLFVGFVKRDPVLFAAILLAVVSVYVIRPAPIVCYQAIDFRTIDFCDSAKPDALFIFF